MSLISSAEQEFMMVREQYQTAIDKLEHLALSSKEPLTNTSGDEILFRSSFVSVSISVTSSVMQQCVSISAATRRLPLLGVHQLDEAKSC